MSLRQVWAVLAVALPALGALVAPMSTIDLAYHLRAGGEMLAGQGIPRVDAWTYTVNGAPWLDQQWGAQVVLAAIHASGGWVGLAVARAILVGTVFGLVALAGIRAGASMRTAAALAIAAFAVSAVSLGLRPQLLGMVAFAALLVLVGERHRHPRLLWISPLIAAAWATLHGSFVFAPLLVGLAWLEDLVGGRGHRALPPALLTLLATVATPLGAEVWTYALGLTADPDVRERVTEWQPPSVTDVPGLLFFGSGVLVALALARVRPRPSWPSLLTLAAFFGLGVLTARGIPWWALVAAVTVARLMGDRSVALSRSESREPRTNPRLNVAVVALVLVAIVLAVPVWRPTDAATGAPSGVLTDAPPGVTRHLRADAASGKRLFAPQHWGSWLEFSVPAAAVAVDSRIELFPSEVWADYGTVSAASSGWDEVLRRWSVSHLIVESSTDVDARIDEYLAGGWIEAYRGPDGVILTPPR